MFEEKSISRREALSIVGGAGFALLTIDNLGAQPPPAGETALMPKKVTANFHLTKAAVEHAKAFKLGSKAVAMKLDTANSYALVKDFAVPKAVALKLGRTENVIEAIACPITDAQSLKAIHDHLHELKVPKEIIEKSAFFYSRGGHRVHTDKKDAMILSKEYGISNEKEFILGIAHVGHKVMTTMALRGNGGAHVMDGVADPKGGGGSVTAPSSTSHGSDAAATDAAKCIEEYLTAIAPFVPLIAIFCTACFPALIATPFSLPIALVACGACGVGIAAVLISTYAVCHS